MEKALKSINFASVKKRFTLLNRNMSDIKTVDPGSQPEKQWLEVQKIEKEKRDKEEVVLKQAKKKNPEALLLGGFLAFAKKIFTFVSSSTVRGKFTFVDSITDLIVYLDDFKNVLVKLSQTDESQNPEFVQDLSSAWHHLIEALGSLEWMERKKAQENGKIKTFVETLRNYPLAEEHTLGFYLTEFAGRAWLPFPFMQLLQSIHLQYQQEKEKSPLFAWIATLSEIIQTLTPQPE
jgi:hypothetical protein